MTERVARSDKHLLNAHERCLNLELAHDAITTAAAGGNKEDKRKGTGEIGNN